MFDIGFIHHVFFDADFAAGGIEDLFLDLRMHFERGADLIGELLLLAAALGFLEFFEPIFDLAVIGFQQRDRVGRGFAPAGAALGVGLGLCGWHVLGSLCAQQEQRRTV